MRQAPRSRSRSRGDEAGDAVERFRDATVESFDEMLETTTVADLLSGGVGDRGTVAGAATVPAD